jgi:hypothetical protein
MPQQEIQLVVTLKNFPEEIGLELSEAIQKNMFMLMTRNAVANMIRHNVEDLNGNIQHLAASVGEIIVEIPGTIKYTVLGRVGVEMPSKALLESTNDDKIPTPV